MICAKAQNLPTGNRETKFDRIGDDGIPEEFTGNMGP